MNIDFATPRRWPAALLWGGAAAAFVLVGYLVSVDLRRWDALSSARSGTAALQSQFDLLRASRAAEAASATQVPPYAVDARRRLTTMAFDTGGVLRSLESARIPGAKVTNLDIDAEGGHVELELEVTSADVAAAYLQALNAGLDRPRWELARLQTQGGTETALIHGQGL